MTQTSEIENMKIKILHELQKCIFLKLKLKKQCGRANKFFLITKN